MTLKEAEDLWEYKYRPKTLNEMVLDAEVRKTFELYREKHNVSHILLVSTPGQGKTTFAKVIATDILDSDYLYINASDENGIDTIRTKVVGFAQTKSFDGKRKVIILDESDGLTIDSQKALRNVIETYSNNTRFILTANYSHKISDALKSRCTSISINPKFEDVVKHCYNILKRENVSVADDQKEAFIELVRKHFPDIRATIRLLQKYSLTGKLEIKSVNVIDTTVSDLTKILLSSGPLEARKYVIENELSFQADYHHLLKQLLEYFYESSIEDSKKSVVISTIAEHLYKQAFVVDQEINCFACLINIHRHLV